MDKRKYMTPQIIYVVDNQIGNPYIFLLGVIFGGFLMAVGIYLFTKTLT